MMSQYVPGSKWLNGTVLLTNFPAQVKYAEIPLILPNSQTPWKQSSKKEFQAVDRLFVFVQVPVLYVLMHADVHVLYKSKYIYI